MNIDFSIGSLNAINSTKVGWVQDPQGRGTASLLVSCLSTLVLCVWSAMHLNLPKQHENAAKHVWEYIKWSMLGVFGPELVIWTAWRQYISAQALQDKSDSPHFWSRKGPSLARQSPGIVWSMTHGFYAGMGGFVIELDESTPANDTDFIPDHKRLTLTARGVSLLAECGLLPQISKEEILDKSKTDGVGKFLACLQAGWMTLQVVTRLVMHLPVTLLEVNTIGHVLCGLLVYVLWWNKPRWIQEPTKLDGRSMRALCAFMYMSSSISAPTQPQGVLLRDFKTTSELSPLTFRLERDAALKQKALNPRSIERAQSSPASFLTEPSCNGNLSDGRSPLTVGVFALRPQLSFPAPSMTPTMVERSDKSAVLATDHMRERRWNLAAEAIKDFEPVRNLATQTRSKSADKMAKAQRLYPEMPSRFKKVKANTRPSEHDWLEWDTVELVRSSAQNWPSDDLLRRTAGLKMGTILWVASMGFGAVHIAAWDAVFPTTIEAWLWRFSSLYIVFAGLLWAFINMLSMTSATVWWYWFDVLDGDVSWVSYTILGISCTLGGLSYIFARVYLVVEVFLSLRAVPLAAYIVPQWTLSLPHL